MIQDVHWCDGCRCKFPLKQLKGCGACRTEKYCSTTCQTIAWKNGHKEMCREIVVQKNLLKGWAHTWGHLFRLVTACALDFGSRPGARRDRRLEIELRKTGSTDLNRAYEVLNGRCEPKEADSPADGEGPHNRLVLDLFVKDEEGERIDHVGISWDLPNFFPDTPKMPEKWEEHCVGVLKSIVANSKPRHAVRDAMHAMEPFFCERNWALFR